MRHKTIVLTVGIMLGVFAVAAAEAVEGPRIDSWSNSKTADQKTAFAVEPGQKITFSVKAEGAEKYLWLVDGKVQDGAKNASFQWTVPSKKGMWKICVNTTSNAREKWAKERAASCDKWLSAQKHGKKHPDEKEKFVQGIRNIHTWPVQSEKEWIVATSLTTVKPGKSIQKAIDSLPPEGGIVELAPGTHEVTEEMYPLISYTYKWWRKYTVRCSISIKRGNVTIAGTRDSTVKLHHRGLRAGDCCFFVPQLESPPENITFTGFTVASDRKRRGGVISAMYVKNFTVANIHDESWALVTLGVSGSTSVGKTSQDVTIKNNTFEHSSIGASRTENIRILNNTMLNCRYGNQIATDHALKYMYVIGNRIIKASGGANCGILVDNPRHCLVSDNFVEGTQKPIRDNNSGVQTIIENNILTGGSMAGLWITCQYNMPESLIRNNLIYNNKDGVYTSAEFRNRLPYTHIRLTNNIICNNRRDGIHTGAKEVSMIVSNNIIANNKGYGINYKIKGPLTLSHNNVWNNGSGNYNGIAAGPGDFSADPLFVDPSKRDYHLKSKAGRWDPKARTWVKDAAQSPCIDTGDPKADYSREPAPNGGQVNVGAYGNTEEASKSLKK